MLSILALIVISVGGIFLSFKYLLTTNPNLMPYQSLIKGIKNENLSSENVSEIPWWNYNFNNYKQITVENSSSRTLTKDTTISLQFNHTDLVQNKKSNNAGSDLRIVYRKNDEYKKLNMSVVSPNTKRTTLQFPIFSEIEAGSSDSSYFLYYNNVIAQSSILGATEESQEQQAVDISQLFQTSMGNEKHHVLHASTSRQWILKDSNFEVEYSKLQYKVEVDNSLSLDSVPSYTVLNTSLKGELKQQKGGAYKATVPVQTLDPGVYQLQTEVISNEEKIKSPKRTFYISYPIYVVLSVDWEGYDVSDEELSLLKNFSKEHTDMPYTQFFNPRIYVTNDVSQDRAEFLTQWILERKSSGDEIGLHLHMHHDMVEAAGVKPKKEPTWTNYMTNGHDVPTSAYSYKQFKKILVWTKKQFEDNGLSAPLSFRAGGWFANLDTLRALNDEGFIIDSSGRDYYLWGANQIQGYWNLTSKTKPYQPSTTNQNSSTPAPTFSLWEFPNNGANSWFYPSENLIKRFQNNYTGEPLQESQTLTYLTHPHQFHIDYDVLTPTYNYIDQFLASGDNGAVVYTTLQDVYKTIAE